MEEYIGEGALNCRGQIEIDEHYRIKRGPLRTVRLGTWAGDGRGFLQPWPPPYVWERRSNLTGVSLVETALPFSW